MFRPVLLSLWIQELIETYWHTETCRPLLTALFSGPHEGKQYQQATWVQSATSSEISRYSIIGYNIVKYQTAAGGVSGHRNGLSRNIPGPVSPVMSGSALHPVSMDSAPGTWHGNQEELDDVIIYIYYVFLNELMIAHVAKKCSLDFHNLRAIFH